MSTLLAIVENHLREGGFDGLYNPGECSCVVGDLFPCGAPQADCSPGVKVPCDCGEGCDCHIASKSFADNSRSGEKP